MVNSPVRIAIVGLDHWYWAFSLAEAVASEPNAEIVALADADLERAHAAARRFCVERVTADAGELIEDAGIDVLASFISVDQNPRVCVAAARSGKHIFSTKPLAMTLDQATDILMAVRQAGVVFMPAESYGRLTRQNRELKQWISEGRLGRILTASFSQHAGLPQRWPDDSDSGWFIDPARAPGGGWIDHSIYHIDRLRWLLDDEAQQVSGWLGRLKYPELPIEDYGTAQIEFKSGVTATMEITWIAPPKGGRSSMSLIGTEGAVAHDTVSGHFSVVGNFPSFTGWVHTTAQARNTESLDHLLTCIRGEENPAATVDDAWRNLAVCRAFYEAAAAGTAVIPAGLPD